ncbi:MAG TPA: 16S rRNA (guanine(966)-N(2))-methyltransferase RsmD [Mariprofundaceae bacterium]|nr:16S rRNA (guanine(966)-N(2))-methyltransferase RsmD [Mariprofundaceae bacterium]
MRVTGGDLRGRIVPVPDLPGLRPTPSKVREALFNILGDIDGFRVLDLFSGSGIMAVESLSRGANSVVSVEQQRRAVAHLQQLCRALSLSQGWRILPLAVERALPGLAGESFDLVFADPPYAKGYAEKLPAWLSVHGVRVGQLVIEESAKVEPLWPAGWTCRQSRRYGDTTLHFLIPETA